MQTNSLLTKIWMTTSIAEAILQGAHKLRLAGVPEARREAGSLLAYVLDRDRSFILTHAEDVLDQQHLDLFHRYLGRRAAGEPSQYITGHQEFFGLDFEVNRDVLIPRPETELLIETALKLVKDADESQAAPFICDVGTGSGCIAITLAHELPSARVVAVDISPAAIAVAKRNVRRLPAPRHGSEACPFCWMLWRSGSWPECRKSAASRKRRQRSGQS